MVKSHSGVSQKVNHRLHALCPYFAMFPPRFVREQLLAHTKPGEVVFDGFSGRGTTLLESLLNDRQAIACDINPVAYCITAAKANPLSLTELLAEIERLELRYRRRSKEKVELERRMLSQFFRCAFHPETLRQVLFLRSALDWRGTRLHRFLAALVLGHLHGEMNRSNNYLSNQMPHWISTKPSYSLKYWKKYDLQAPRRDVFELLRHRAAFRLEEGTPVLKGKAACCDVREVGKVFIKHHENVGAVITSPPYLDVTKFEEDQWLRLWFLGGPPHPTYGRVSRDDRHRSELAYWQFLEAAWRGMKPLLKKKAVMVCRIGARATDPDELAKRFTRSLTAVWSRVCSLASPVVTALPSSQAKNLSPEAKGCRVEVDLAYQVCM